MLAAILLGLLAGLRTFTAPAVLLLMRRGGAFADLLGALALVEYALDLSPRAPPRTQLFGLTARAVSGAFCGWFVTRAHGAGIAGALLAAAAAIGGAYGGLAIRRAAIALLGPVPAALLEDLFTAAASVAVVAYA